MNDVRDRPRSDAPPAGLEPPPPRRVLLTTAATLIAAAVVLVVVVLPAEYQIDPTGLGRLLGLDRLRGASADGSVYLPQAEEGAVALHDEPFRTEEVAIDIAAREEIEYKIAMVEGATVVFTWSTDRGVLYSDFHAEPFNDLNDSPVRYAERTGVSSGSGSLRAPYSGHHGWYWRNENDHPIVVTLRVSGYFTGFRELHRAPIS